MPKKSTSPKTARSLRSKTKQKRQEQDIESLASISSPVKNSKSKKLLPICKHKKAALPTVSKDLKQASVDLPERKKGTIAQVVKETKQNKTSIEEKEQSTGSDSTNLPVTQVSTTINLSRMADSRLDAKLEHLLTTYFLAIGNNLQTIA